MEDYNYYGNQILLQVLWFSCTNLFTLNIGTLYIHTILDIKFECVSFIITNCWIKLNLVASSDADQM